MTAIQIQNEIRRLKAKWGIKGNIREDIPRCPQCGMILIVDDFGNYTCVNSDIHSSFEKKNDICYTIIEKGKEMKHVKRSKEG